MAVAKRTKAADKQDICKKLMTLLKKRYTAKLPKVDRPILENILYGICLENAAIEQADRSYQRLHTDFHDLNEARVSSVRELETAFEDSLEPEWRALRVRYLLQHVFESRYSYDFELLQRKTLDLASKELSRIKYLSPFVRFHTLQTALGSHLVPVDARMCLAATWLGLLEPSVTVDTGSEALKSAVRKPDVPLFCHLLRRFATDPEVQFAFHKKEHPQEGYDLLEATMRLTDVFGKVDEKRKKKASRKKKQAKEQPNVTKKKKPAPRSALTRKTSTKKKAKKKVVKKAKKRISTRTKKTRTNKKKTR